MKGLASRAIVSCPGRAAEPLTTEAEQQRLQTIALSRWENEGGASRDVPQAGSASGGASFDDPAWARTEAEQLRIRVIALENLVIALLAQALESHLAPCPRDGGLHLATPGLRAASPDYARG